MFCGVKGRHRVHGRAGYPSVSLFAEDTEVRSALETITDFPACVQFSREDDSLQIGRTLEIVVVVVDRNDNVEVVGVDRNDE